MTNNFIRIGNVNLKRSNIKSFGVSTTTKTREEKPDGIWHAFWIGFKGRFIVETREVRYLFVTTFQNDNYTFDEDEIDIDRALASLQN